MKTVATKEELADLDHTEFPIVLVTNVGVFTWRQETSIDGSFVIDDVYIAPERDELKEVS